MGWRIDEFLVRGEIDNRIRGQVTGRLWFSGQKHPVELELTGNAWRDLAGRRLELVNPAPRDGLHGALAPRQVGVVGDITASRKVKVPDVPMEQLFDAERRGQPISWHWGNSLYLEWFSETNGRVVIESAAFRLIVDPDVTWDMTEAEEGAQRAANARAMQRFVDQLAAPDVADLSADAAPENPSATDPGELLGDADRPLTEEEAERLQQESDKLTDRVQARMEQEGPGADLGRIIEEEIERARRERGEPEPTEEEREERRRWIDAMNAAAEDPTAGPPGELADDDPAAEEGHPIVGRSRALTLHILAGVDAHGWLPDGADRDHPVVELQSAAMKSAAKIAGALGRREWPPPRDQCAAAVVWLKRAHRYLDYARLAAAICRTGALVDAVWIDNVMREMDALASEVADLISELRARLERGFD